MHGTLAYGEELKDIKSNGLIARRGSNSYAYDEVLGRTAFVFVAPATFRLQYGFGGGSILIDPEVLTLAGLKCSDRDVDEVFACLKILAEDHGDPSNYSGGARERSSLAKFIVQAEAETKLTDPEELALAVLKTEQFREYLSRNYELTVDDLFARIETAAASINLERYFSRNNMWREEILVPEKIAPEYLLGHWDSKNWAPWNNARSQDTQTRLDAWLQAAANYRRR